MTDSFNNCPIYNLCMSGCTIVGMKLLEQAMMWKKAAAAAANNSNSCSADSAENSAATTATVPASHSNEELDIDGDNDIDAVEDQTTLGKRKNSAHADEDQE